MTEKVRKEKHTKQMLAESKIKQNEDKTEGKADAKKRKKMMLPVVF
jgi:hypothetical protein